MRKYKTGEASLILGISSDMLRYYSSKYFDILDLKHIPQKHRYYTESDIKKLYRIIYDEELIDIESKLNEPITKLQYNEIIEKLMDVSNQIECINKNMKITNDLLISSIKSSENNKIIENNLETKIDFINEKNDKILAFHSELLSIWLKLVNNKSETQNNTK